MAERGGGSTQNYELFTSQVDATIIKPMQANVVNGKCTRLVPVGIGNTREYNTQDNNFSFTKFAEGNEITGDNLEFTRNVIAFDELGIAPRINKRFIEDAEWDIVTLTLEEIGFAAARQLNEDFLTSLNGSVPGAHTLAGSDWSSANADPLGDLGTVLGYIEADEFGTSPKWILHPTNYREMTMDANFLSTLTSGKADSIAGELLRTTAQTAGTAHLIDSDWAMNFYDRKGLTIEQVDIPRRRQMDIVAYMRYGYAVIRSNALGKLTGL